MISRDGMSVYQSSLEGVGHGFSTALQDHEAYVMER